MSENMDGSEMRDDIIKVIRKGVEEICQDYDIITVYLYGSFVHGEQHSDSDIDIAIFFKDYSLRKLLEVSRKIQEEVEIPRQLDIQALNTASPRFQFRVIQHGKVLYESTPKERADIEVEIDRRYHDLKPHLEEHWTERRKRLIKNG